MRSRALSFVIAAALMVPVRIAGAAEPVDPTAQADALFRSAKVLRAAGSYDEACAAFAESKRLAPGIGVSLYLADCYERAGKSARAWSEFRDAEARARERKDRRADVAHARAAALEPRLGHLGITLSAGGALPGAEVTIDDGEPLAARTWTPVVLDAGEHAIRLRVGGKTVRTAHAQVIAGRWALASLDGSPPPPAPAPSPPGRAADDASGASTSPKPSTRQVAGYSLLAAGVAGVAVGTGLLFVKNQSLSTGAPSGPATVDQGAAIGSDVAFAIGGAALVSAVVLYLTAPADREAAFVVAPGPVTGGAGAFVSGRF